ncbi:MAG: hypothetical protein KHX55_00460 [Proteobacteria bacterium]|nr:hypothetical protein [Pseudomonadota bacterium]
MKSEQKGGTMMEALMVLSIITVLSISGIKLMNGLFTMFKQNMVSNELIEIQKNIAARYRVFGYYNDIPTDIEDWKKEKLLPSQMIANDEIHHRLGGKVTILPKFKNADDELAVYYTVQFDGIPQKTCFVIGQINWTMSQSSDLIELKINDHDPFVLPTRDSGVEKGADNALPVKLNVLMDACKSGDNTMIWTFR